MAVLSQNWGPCGAQERGHAREKRGAVCAVHPKRQIYLVLLSENTL